MGRLTIFLTSKISSHALRWTLSIGAALLALVLSWIIFAFQGLFLPASDDSMFRERTSLFISFQDDLPSGKARLFSIGVTAPTAIQVHQDAALDFSIEAQAAQLRSVAYQASLNSGKEVESRTTHPCQGAGAARDGKSCASGSVGRPVRWFIRSDQPGNSFVTLELPEVIQMELIKRQGTWSARIARDGQPLRSRAPSSDSSPGSRFVDSGPVVVMSEEKPVFSDAQVEIDLRSSEITVPINFKTTLGVSAATYLVLSNSGAVLSALLGGGWLWQLLSWLRQRRSVPELRRSRDQQVRAAKRRLMK